MIHLIQQVKQLNNTDVKNHEEKPWTGQFHQIPIIENFKQMNIQLSPYVQPQQYTPVCQKMPQPTNLITAQNLPCFSCKLYTLAKFNIT